MEFLNTLSGKKEPFVPLQELKVNMYVCGPTTYNYIHLGNARPLVVFDTLRRYLTFCGYDVCYVQNFTDIDDKIIARAKEEGMEAGMLAAKYIEEYFKDAKALEIQPADFHPKVSEHIPEIISLIEKLLADKYAYVVDGDVYYRVNAFKEYGKLSGRSLEDMMEGARVGVDERKEHPGDFALWKAAKPDEPAWQSPWGLGRPGWHIECSAMSTKYLGETLDIHGGGADLIFPHHENEIAQSEAANGKPLARYWLHNGFITVNQEKMSKSLGNFFLMREILQQYSGEVIRFYLLSTHYRNPLDFDDSKLLESKKALGRLKNTLNLAESFINEKSTSLIGLIGEKSDFMKTIDQHYNAFIAAMDNDLNTAAAIGFMFDLARSLNTRLAEADKNDPSAQTNVSYGITQLKEIGEILGVLQPETQDDRVALESVLKVMNSLQKALAGETALLKAWQEEMQQAGIDLSDHTTCMTLNTDQVMDAILSFRQTCRSVKKYMFSDLIRDEMKASGIILEDTKEGARWKLVDA